MLFICRKTPSQPLLGLALLLLLAACQPKAIPMTLEEAQRVESLTANMTTRCVGRYLIDMPARFVLNSESTTEIEGVKIHVEPVERKLFDYTLETREIVLRREHMTGKPNAPFLRGIEASPTVEVGKVFNRAKSFGSAGIARTLELLAWNNGFMISMEINATDYPGAGFNRKDDPPNDTPEKLAHLLKIYERVSGRKDNEVPNTPGLCLPNGFVAGAGREGQETDAVYHLADAPDVWFGFGSSDAIKEADTLLQRAPRAETAMAKNGAKTLRKGKRTIHGQEFEEVLMGNTLEQDGIRGNKFLMHGNELRFDPLQPFIDLGFYNGNRIPVPELTMEQKDKLRLNEILTKATLTDAEALAIWDKVSATLRARPGAF